MQSDRKPVFRHLLVVLALAVLYGLAAATAIAVSRLELPVASIWIANAIAITFLLRQPVAIWPALLGGAFVGGVGANLAFDLPLLPAVGFMSANVFEVTLAAGLASVWLGRPIRIVDDVWAYLKLILIAALAAPAASAIFGAAVGATTFDVPYGAVFLEWLTGGAAGTAAVLPLTMMATCGGARSQVTIRNAAAASGLALMAVGLAYLAIKLPGHPMGLVVVSITIGALVLPPAGTALVAMVTVFGVIGTGPLADVEFLTPGSAGVGAVAAVLTIAPLSVAIMIEQLRADRLASVARAARLRAAMDGSAIGMGMADADNRLISVNQSLCNFLGYSEDELIQMDRRRITHPDDYDETERQLAALKDGSVDTVHMHKRYIRKDGKMVWAYLSRTALTDADGNVTGSFIQVVDLTEQKKAEEALARSEQRWAFALESARQGVWDCDFRTGKTYNSDVWASMLGYRLDEIDDDLHYWKTMIHPDDRPRVEAADELNQRVPGGYFEMEYRMRHKDGRWIWIHDRGRVVERDETGEPLRMIGTHTDITERKNAEEKVRLLSQRVQIAAKAGGVGLWEFRPETGELWWDEKMRSLYGLTPDEAVNYDRWVQAVHPDDRSRAELEVEESLLAGAPYDTELRIVQADGSIRHVRSFADRITTDDGSTYLSGTNWDVTETHRLTADLAAEKERLRVTLESIGDGVVTTDTEARVTFMNRVAEIETGWSLADAHRKPLDEVFLLIDESADMRIANPVGECLETRRVYSSHDDHVLVNRAGRRRDIRATAAPIVADDGELLGAVLVFQDVTKARQLRRQLSYSATHDALTDLRNRPYFERELRVLCDDAGAGPARHCLCFIDLDRFKTVNDTAGHAAGDALLRTLARTLRQSVRSGDTVARLGGDEFALLLRDCDPDAAVAIAQKVVDALSRLDFTFGEHTFSIGASIGVAAIDGRSSPSEVLSTADTACYEAKAAGRNMVALSAERPIPADMATNAG